MPNQLATAIALAAEYFEDTTDKSGEPYILHCLHVMYAMPEDDPELRSIAVLHDIVEDTEVTLEELREEGFSERVIEGVAAMTHDKDVSYGDYIKRIALSEDATKVKLADLRHNSDITRLKGLTKKDFDRMEKYHHSYKYLSKTR